MRNARTLLMNKGYTEDEAVTILSTAADFGITQVLNESAHFFFITRQLSQ